MLYQPMERKTAPKEKYNVQHTSLRNKSLYNPPVSDNGHIEVFKRMVVQDLHQMELRKVNKAKNIKNWN